MILFACLYHIQNQLFTFRETCNVWFYIYFSRVCRLFTSTITTWTSPWAGVWGNRCCNTFFLCFVTFTEFSLQCSNKQWHPWGYRWTTWCRLLVSNRTCNWIYIWSLCHHSWHMWLWKCHCRVLFDSKFDVQHTLSCGIIKHTILNTQKRQKYTERNTAWAVFGTVSVARYKNHILFCF